MDKETQQYFEDYFDLFSTDGWKQFIEELEDIIDTFSIENIKDQDDLKTTQGQLQILNRIANFEDSIRNAYDQAEDVND